MKKNLRFYSKYQNSLIIEENIDTAKYYFDAHDPKEFSGTEFSIPPDLLTEGTHALKVTVTDTVGHNVTEEFAFIVDSKAPELVIKSPQNGSTISNTITIDLEVKEQNLPETGGMIVILPNGIVSKKIIVNIDNKPLFGNDKESSDQNLIFLQGIIIGIVIATAATLIAVKKIKTSKKI